MIEAVWEETKAIFCSALMICLWGALVGAPTMLIGTLIDVQPGTGVVPLLVLVFAVPALMACVGITDFWERLRRKGRYERP